MGAIIVLILFPMVVAGILTFIKDDKTKTATANVAAVMTAAVTIAAAVWGFLVNGEYFSFGMNMHDNFCVDNLSVILIFISGITGIFAVMAGSRKAEWLLLIGSTTGIAVSNDLRMTCIFWIISIPAVCLIKGSRRGFCFEVLGAASMIIGVIMINIILGTTEISEILLTGKSHSMMAAAPAIFIVLAAMIRCSQLPFCPEETGAKASHPAPVYLGGAFLIIRFASILGTSNYAGLMALVCGSITFLFYAGRISLDGNWKTMTRLAGPMNMGLVFICCAAGEPNALWLAVMIVIYQAASDMLAHISEADSPFMLFALGEMVMVPVVLLVSKWPGITAIIDSGDLVVIVAIVFGTACLAGGFMRIAAGRDNFRNLAEKSRLSYIMTAILLALCLASPLISMMLVTPLLEQAFGVIMGESVLSGNITAMIFMCLVPLVLALPGFFSDEESDNEVKAVVIDERPISAKGRYIEAAGILIAAVVTVLLICYAVALLSGMTGGVLR